LKPHDAKRISKIKGASRGHQYMQVLAGRLVCGATSPTATTPETGHHKQGGGSNWRRAWASRPFMTIPIPCSVMPSWSSLPCSHLHNHGSCPMDLGAHTPRQAVLAPPILPPSALTTR